MSRILLLEDDEALGRGICMALETPNCTVTHCSTRLQAIKILQGGHDFRQEFIESDTSAAESDEIEIVRTKRFGIKPMFPEDACIQMELLGHNFFVFCNAETDQVNVVYKRKGDTYGLIEPEV